MSRMGALALSAALFGAAVALSPPRASADFPLPIYPSCPAGGKVAADFDRDGHLDVMVGCAAGGAQLLRGDGTGALSMSEQGGGPTAEPSGEMIAADFNEDGIPDIATRSWGLDPPILSVLIGNGSGALTETAHWSGPTGREAPIVSGDVDGDGHLDLVAAGTWVAVYFGRGDGTFDRITAPFGLPFAAHRMTATDLDGDADLDLVVTGSTGAGVAVVSRGTGDGNFEPPVFYPVGADSSGHLVVDLDGDSRPEIVVASRGSSDLSILENRGDGTFAPESRVPVGEAPVWIALLRRGAAEAREVLVRTFPTEDLLAFPIAATGGLGAPRKAFPARFGIGNPILGDLEGRGVDSLIWAASQGVTTTPIRDDGMFSGPIGIGLDLKILGLAAGDVDGDGHLDLVTMDIGVAPSEILVLRGDGKGAFAPPIRTPMPYYFGPHDIKIHDLDRDGRGDLILRGAGFDRSLAVLRANEDATVELTFEDGTPPYWGNVVVGDRDGDGTEDLVSGAPHGLQTYRGLGGCDFERGPFVETGPDDVAWFTFVDFTGDGRDDVIASDGQTTYSYRSLPEGGLERPPLRVSWGGGEIVPVDLDGDGRDEVVVGRRTVNRYDERGWWETVRWWHGREQPRFADLDGDGRFDICGGTVDDAGARNDAIYTSISGEPSSLRQYLVGWDSLGRTVTLIADFIEDGLPELVVPPNNARQSILIYPNLGTAPNRAPTAHAGPDQQLECSEAGGASARLNGGESTDEDGDALQYAWSAGSVPLDPPDAIETSGIFPLGTTEATLVVTDGRASATDSLLVSVVDTTVPRGAILAPEAGACFGLRDIPVSVVDDFEDVCDPALERAYAPEGPEVAEHGDHEVTVAATDRSGNAASGTVGFTIDLEPPIVSLVSPGSSGWIGSLTVPLSVVFRASDDDGAKGDVVRETISVAGCVAYDGRNYGDGDGRLSDESIVLSVAELCRIQAICGWAVLEQPEIRVEADDCAGNAGSAATRLRGRLALRPGICGR